MTLFKLYIEIFLTTFNFKKNKKLKQQYKEYLKNDLQAAEDLDKFLTFLKSCRMAFISSAIFMISLIANIIIVLSTNINYKSRAISSCICALLSLISSICIHIAIKKALVKISNQYPSFSHNLYNLFTIGSLTFITFESLTTNIISIILYSVVCISTFCSMYQISEQIEKKEDYIFPKDFNFFITLYVHPLILYIVYMMLMPNIFNYISIGLLSFLSLIYLAAFLYLFFKKIKTLKRDLHTILTLCFNAIFFIILCLLITINITKFIEISSTFSFVFELFNS